jgi:hypothetical protein
MRFLVSLALAIIAGIATLSGILQGYVAMREIITHHIQSGQRKKWFFILLCFIIASVSSYGVYDPSLLRLDSSSSTPSPIAPSTSLSSSSSSTPGPTPTSLSSSSTPSPTPTPKMLTVNRQLVCTSGDCSFYLIHITVISFSIDTTLKQTSMRFSLDSHENCADAFVSALKFQDSTGNTYTRSEQTNNNFSLAKGQSLTLTAIYSFVPSSGLTYTLSTKFFCGMPEIDYGDTQFTF